MKQEIIKFNFKFKNNDFYVSTKNELAYKMIKKWPEWPTKVVYIYGSEKCGKSLVCKLWKDISRGIYINKKNFLEKLIAQNDLGYIQNHNWIIDDVDYIISFEDNKYEEKILNLINIIKTSGKNNILMASRKMPRLLDSGLKDLISRISSATVIEMRDPDEILLKKIIEKYLNERNIQINNESLDYLINRIERSYKSALKFAKMIDFMSLEKKTKINKSFLKSILN
ncbi:MAG: DnaA ATPase domain-containing protein [Alphaproteobacteria bacterium]